MTCKLPLPTGTLPYRLAQTDHGLSEIHAGYARFPGKDPSVGNDTHIYGIESSNVGPTESACLVPPPPPGPRPSRML